MISPDIDWAAFTVFVVLFAAVTIMGFVAAKWRKPATLAHLDEWGLGGRQFGTWITWFLVGGDFYTAYTVIAVPALVYAVGAYGFFALPYTILVYPIVFTIMPRLWSVAAKGGHVTAADVVHAAYGSSALELAVALTGVLATMPYIALQLIGMEVVIKALGLNGEIPLIAAFLILALYTYSSGLRAPALIAFVKDIMIYIVVLVAVALIPFKLGRVCGGVRGGGCRVQGQACGRDHAQPGADAAVCDAGSGLGDGGVHVSAYADGDLRPRRAGIRSRRTPFCCRPIRCCSG